MENGLGILVWTTLIVGSVTVLGIALRDVLVWGLGLVQRLRPMEREAYEEPVVATRLVHAVERPHRGKRL